MRTLLWTGISVAVVGSLGIGLFLLDAETATQYLERDIFVYFQEQVLAAGIAAPFIFILLYVLITVFVFWLPVWPFSVVGGALFGFWFGTLYSVTGATIGALGAFLLVRSIERGITERWVKKYIPRFHEYHKNIGRHGLLIVFTTRLIPVFPFRGLNYGFGTTTVSLKDFSIGTFVGILPGTAVFSYLGASLTSLDGVHILSAIGITLVFSGLVYYYQQRALKKERSDQ